MQSVVAQEFETIVVEDIVRYLGKTDKDPYLDYSVSFTYPSKHGNKDVLAKLQKHFIHYTMGEAFSLLTPEEAVKACIADWKTAYNKEMANSSSPAVGWKVTCRNSITLINETLLQLKTEGELYSLTNRIIETTTYALFNRHTGAEYSLNDIFKPEINRKYKLIPETSFAVTETGILFAGEVSRTVQYTEIFPYLNENTPVWTFAEDKMK